LDRLNGADRVNKLSFDPLLKKKGFIYYLFGIIVYRGSLDSGHYYSYVKKDGIWFLCNDSEIRDNVEPTFDDVGILMVFYNRT
jgi:ubiquitin C-terminal hydrolase